MMPYNTQNYTEPKIVTTTDFEHRSYVSFYFNNKIVKEYHGKNIGLPINPNRAKTLDEKHKLLNKLLFEIHKALEAGKYPVSQSEISVIQPISRHQLPESTEEHQLSAIQVLFQAIRGKIKSNLSRKYKRNLKSVYRQFRDFMSRDELNGSITKISTLRIDVFLSQFSSTGTYYMNKRRDLGVLFASAGRMIENPISAVQKSQKRKSKAKLHKPYDKAQIKPILNYLAPRYPKLYLCCLLTYSSWLRPHEEVRLLTLGDFKKDWSEVHLSGDENKGGKVRVVYIPDYVQAVLTPILSTLSRNANIFSSNSVPFNESYFNTAWSRAYKEMFALGLIYEDQTIYSFRHTAAIAVYRKTKDVYLLQKLLGHSSILVTLKYLRSLGEFNSDELRDAAPTL